MKKCKTCEEIISLLKEIEKEKWDDAEHCTCLGYAIHHVEEMFKKK